MYISPIRRFRILYRKGLILSVVGAIAIVVWAWVWLTKVTLYHEHFTLYFNTDVHGLSVGAPVVMNGQSIGQVSEITLVAKADGNGRDVYYPAISIVVDAQKLRKLGRLGDNKPFRDALPLLIAVGLRGKLQKPSLLASGLSVFLYLDPDRPAFFLNLPDADYPEIPTDYRSSSDYVDRVNAYLETSLLYEIAGKILAAKNAISAFQKWAEEADFDALNAQSLARMEKMNAILDPQRVSREISRANAELVAFCETVEKYRASNRSRQDADELREAVKNFTETLKTVRAEALTIQSLLTPENQEDREHILRELRKQNESLIRFVEGLLFSL